MFEEIKQTAWSIGHAVAALPAAARIASDLESGRHPSECDLKMLDLPGDLTI